MPGAHGGHKRCGCRIPHPPSLPFPPRLRFLLRPLPTSPPVAPAGLSVVPLNIPPAKVDACASQPLLPRHIRPLPFCPPASPTHTPTLLPARLPTPHPHPSVRPPPHPTHTSPPAPHLLTHPTAAAFTLTPRWNTGISAPSKNGRLSPFQNPNSSARSENRHAAPSKNGQLSPHRSGTSSLPPPLPSAHALRI